jgi:hypothetical protein
MYGKNKNKVGEKEKQDGSANGDELGAIIDVMIQRV